MAWTKVGETGVAITAGAGNQSVSLPGGTTTGDLVIVATAADISCQNCVATAGYTAPENGNGANPGANLSFKVMGSTPDTTVDIVQHGTVLRATVVQVWRGGARNNANVLDQTYPTAATGNSASPDPPSVVTQTPNALVVAVGWLDDDDTTISNYPTNYTNGVSANTGQASTLVGSTVAVASRVIASPATEDPGAFTFGSSDAWAAGTIAFREIRVIEDADAVAVIVDGVASIPAAATEIDDIDAVAVTIADIPALTVSAAPIDADALGANDAGILLVGVVGRE